MKDDNKTKHKFVISHYNEADFKREGLRPAAEYTGQLRQ